MKKRNVALCVIFSIVTFGLYGFYWLAQINNCVNELADPPHYCPVNICTTRKMP